MSKAQKVEKAWIEGLEKAADFLEEHPESHNFGDGRLHTPKNGGPSTGCALAWTYYFAGGNSARHLQFEIAAEKLGFPDADVAHLRLYYTKKNAGNLNFQYSFTLPVPAVVRNMRILARELRARGRPQGV